MWRMLAIAAAACTVARAEPPCQPVPKFQAAQAAADKTNDERLAAALAKKKLALAALPQATWKSEPRQLDHVVEEREFNGRRASYLLIGPIQCFTPIELVRDDTNVYELVRKPRAGNTTKLGAICGCQAPRVRSTCWSGPQPPVLIHGYELPAGTTYGGKMEIEYVEDRIEATFTKGPCPAPP